MEKNQLELWRRRQGQQQQQQDNGLIALQTKGRALKVHAGDTPHLVSLGGDRFSTAVTLHPIPEGHVKLGSGVEADIPIFGTGVEELHCWIENKEGVVTLYPYRGVDNISVDGLKVIQPTRLTQGCMLCLGRSNFLRFNHPQEAKYMRSVMPNTRVSIIPNVFYPSTMNDRLNVGTASLIPSSNCGGWRDVNGAQLGSIESYYFSKHISPKVFPPGSSTLNSPASVVLGYKYSKNQLSLSHYKSDDIIKNSDNCSRQLSINNDVDDNKTNDIADKDDDNNLNNDANSSSIVGSSESIYQKQRLAIPSPAFDRNPSYFGLTNDNNRNSGNGTVHVNNSCSSSASESFDGDLSPVSSSSPRPVIVGEFSVRRFSPIENCSPSSPASFNELTTTTNGYSSDGSVKKEIVKRSQQAHNNRIIEKEKERLERLRLEEILTLCAEYEKQAQFDRSKSQLSKIKTNGSLPRDKKHCTPSPGCKTPDSPRNGLVVFTFDKSDNSTKTNINDGDVSQCNNNAARDVYYPSSPRSRIKTVASPKEHSREHALELYENKLAVLNNYEILNVSTNSARRTNIGKERRCSNDKQSAIANNLTVDNSNVPANVRNDYDDVDEDDERNRTSLKEMNIRNRYKFFGINPEQCRYNNNDDDEMGEKRFRSITCKSNNRIERDNIGDKSYAASSMEFDKKRFYDNEQTNSVNKITRDSDIEKLNGLVLELNEIVKETELSLRDKDAGKRNSNNVSSNGSNSSSSSSSSSGFHSDDSITVRRNSDDGVSRNEDNTGRNTNERFPIDNYHDNKNNADNFIIANDHQLFAKDTNNNNNNNNNNNSSSNKGGTQSSQCSSLTRLKKNRSNDNNHNNDSKFILPLERINTVLRRQCFTLKKHELKKLQDEQTSLLSAINDIKLKLADIQQQKDEIMKELEIEKALIEAEFKSENSKLIKEEETLSGVQIKIKDCESAIEVCAKSQMDRQAHNTEMINERQAIITKLEQTLSDNIRDENTRKQILQDIRKKHEQLEDEVKKFEDFEFKLLEEEAVLLSKREDLQAESLKINSRIEELRSRVSELFSQKEHLLQNASGEMKSLELQVRNHTSNLQQNHRRLQEISLQLKSTARSLSEISECDTDSSEDVTNSMKTQSQEDLDRISRVTSDAPIMESRGTNSLGRRTIASLQEIERNRQLHLAHQGSHVIEEERKRVLALKQRVQSEVKARWAEQKQRENCNSFNSDNSSLTSFERITESPSNDESKKFSEDDSIGDNNDVIEKNKGSLELTTNSSRVVEDDTVCRRRNTSNASSHHDLRVAFTHSNKSLGGNNIQRPESHHSMRKRESFDLRRHIESAGHLLDRCPQVIVDSTSCRGYLHKMTAKFRTWNKRWFVFDRTKCSFAYYTDKSEKKMRSGTYFQGLIDLYIDKGNMIKSSHPNATFVVKSSERSFYLMAPSVEVMRIWFDVVATEVDVYHDT